MRRRREIAVGAVCEATGLAAIILVFKFENACFGVPDPHALLQVEDGSERFPIWREGDIQQVSTLGP